MRPALVHVCGKQTPSASIYFSARMCFMLLISKCTREPDVGLRTTLGLATRMQLRRVYSRLKNVIGRKICRKSARRSGIPFASPEVAYRATSDSLLHFDSKNIYQIRIENINAGAWRLLHAALLERWPQICRVKIKFTLHYYRRIVSFPQQRIR